MRAGPAPHGMTKLPALDDPHEQIARPPEEATDPLDLVPRLRDPNLLNAFAALADDLRMVLKASGRGESCGQEPASNPRLR